MKVSNCKKCGYYQRRTWSSSYKPANYHVIGVSHAYGFCELNNDRCLNVKECAKMHELKIKPQYFEAVDRGEKRFELRKNDRNYHVGEFINLCEYDNGRYTGRNIVYRISYILKDCPEYGLMDGYCIIGF